jgi:Calx-beta domain/RTX calcium-binding nonapeptide repeat (4 copies)
MAPGSTLGTAQNIGTLTSFSINEALGTTSPTDFYRFSLSNTNNISLLLNGATQDYLYAEVYLDKNNNGLIDSGELLLTSDPDYVGTDSGRLNIALGAGTYFVAVQRSNTAINSSYSLNLVAIATPPSIAIDPGSTLATAYNIGNLVGIQQFKEFVGNTDPLDYYKFSLTNTQNIQLLLSGVTQSYLDPYIYQDKNNNGLIDTGEELYSDYASTSRNGVINTTLGAGTYYVGIRQDPSSLNVNSNYSLQLSATVAPPSIAIDPGSTFGTAYNIGNLAGIQQFKEFVGTVDPLDYYKFSLTNTNTIKFALTGITQNYLNLAVYQDRNSNGVLDANELILDDYAGPSRNGEINVTLGAGNYLVGVRQDPSYSNVNSNYSLLLSAITAPPSISVDPGSTLGTAYNIGNLTGIKEFKEFVGNIDPLDYYKFSLAANNSIKLSFSGVTQNYLNVDIYKDINNNGVIDVNERLSGDYAGLNRNGVINSTLGAGTYYVGVRQDPSYLNANSNYTLQLVNNNVPDPPNTVTLAVSPGIFTEDGLNNLVYTFTRTGSAVGAATVNYTIGGTGVFNTDYTVPGVIGINGTSGTITFAVGSNVATLVVDPTADASIEANETVAITLVAGSGYTVGTPAAVTGTITNDDVLNLAGVSVAIQDVTVVEGKDANALLTVSLSAASSRPVSINYTTTPVDATAGLDYTPRTGTLVIAANSLTGTISIPILNDNLNEADESFIVTLSNPVNATIDPLAGVAEVTISDTLRSAITRILPTGVENLTLTGASAINGVGNAGANKITGNVANNQLSGDAGNDTLVGNGGVDSFLFNGVVLTGANTVATVLGRDSVLDFAVGVDKIALSKNTFAEITSAPGVSIGANFVSVTTDAVALLGTQSAAIIYSQASGNLFYNQNGIAGGFGNGGNFAVLATLPTTLGVTDFVVVA